jgi:hypothetical protein
VKWSNARSLNLDVLGSDTTHWDCELSLWLIGKLRKYIKLDVVKPLKSTNVLQHYQGVCSIYDVCIRKFKYVLLKFPIDWEHEESCKARMILSVECKNSLCEIKRMDFGAPSNI